MSHFTSDTVKRDLRLLADAYLAAEEASKAAFAAQMKVKNLTTQPIRDGLTYATLKPTVKVGDKLITFVGYDARAGLDVRITELVDV